MTIRFEYYNNTTSSYGATIALQHNLFVKAWMLSDALVKTARNRNAELVIAFDYDLPVGVLFIERSMHRWLLSPKATAAKVLASKWCK